MSAFEQQQGAYRPFVNEITSRFLNSIVASGAACYEEPEFDYAIGGSDFSRTAIEDMLGVVNGPDVSPDITWRQTSGAMRGLALGVAMMSTRPSVPFPRKAIEQSKARFRMLKQLPANHDHEGAAAPIDASVDAAIAFLDRLPNVSGAFATLSDDGYAVIEFERETEGFFGEITFLPSGDIECYRRRRGVPSLMTSGSVDAPEIKSFLLEEMDIGL